VLFATEPDAETDPTSQIEIHHRSMGFGGIRIKFICSAVYYFCTSSALMS